MPKAKKSRPSVIRGQAQNIMTPTSEGRVTVTIEGPKGSGKALIENLLRNTLPLMPVDEVEIVVLKTEEYSVDVDTTSDVGTPAFDMAGLAPRSRRR